MPNSDLKLLGEKVRTERKLAGLTQEQLAERCHVSTKHIANIEKGSMNPSYEILLAIARVLPISLDALITPGMDKTEVELKEFNRIYLSCPEAVRETNPKTNQFHTNSVDSQADLNLCFQIICQCRI